MLKKSPFILILITGIIISALIASLMLFTFRYIRITIAALLILLLIWWLMYYYKLKYTMQNNTVCITSGVLFRRHRHINNDNILWTIHVRVPFIRYAVMTCLHTVCGTIYILGDYSTLC